MLLWWELAFMLLWKCSKVLELIFRNLLSINCLKAQVSNLYWRLNSCGRVMEIIYLICMLEQTRLLKMPPKGRCLGSTQLLLEFRDFWTVIFKIRLKWSAIITLLGNILRLNMVFFFVLFILMFFFFFLRFGITWINLTKFNEFKRRIHLKLEAKYSNYHLECIII